MDVSRQAGSGGSGRSPPPPPPASSSSAKPEAAAAASWSRRSTTRRISRGSNCRRRLRAGGRQRVGGQRGGGCTTSAQRGPQIVGQGCGMGPRAGPSPPPPLRTDGAAATTGTAGTATPTTVLHQPCSPTLNTPAPPPAAATHIGSPFRCSNSALMASPHQSAMYRRYSSLACGTECGAGRKESECCCWAATRPCDQYLERERRRTATATATAATDGRGHASVRRRQRQRQREGSGHLVGAHMGRQVPHKLHKGQRAPAAQAGSRQVA